MAADYHFVKGTVLRQLRQKLGDMANRHTRGLYFAWDRGQLTVDTLLYSTNRQWAKLKKNGKRVLAKDREATFIEIMTPKVRQLLDSISDVNPLMWTFVSFTACIFYESNELDIQVTVKDERAFDQALRRSHLTWDNKPKHATVIDLT